MACSASKPDFFRIQRYVAKHIIRRNLEISRQDTHNSRHYLGNAQGQIKSFLCSSDAITPPLVMDYNG